jgi:hypothetical protein
LKAPRAFDVHKERIWGLHQPLELVRTSLLFGRWVQKIARHFFFRTRRETIDEQLTLVTKKNAVTDSMMKTLETR